MPKANIFGVVSLFAIIGETELICAMTPDLLLLLLLLLLSHGEHRGSNDSTAGRRRGQRSTG